MYKFRDNDDAYIIYDDGDTEFVPEEAVKYLLEQDVVFVNFFPITLFNGHPDSPTAVLFVNTNDVFAWGFADAENIKHEDALESLYIHVRMNPKWGSTQWACKQRKEKPQKPVMDSMKEQGAWTAELEALPDNNYDKMRREERERKEKQ